MKINNFKMNEIPELKIGSGEKFKSFNINLGFKKFKLTIRW